MDSFCLFRLANFIPNFTLDNGVVVTLWDVGNYKVITFKPISPLPVHEPRVLSGMRVGVGVTFELDRVSLGQEAVPRAASEIR